MTLDKGSMNELKERGGRGGDMAIVTLPWNKERDSVGGLAGWRRCPVGSSSSRLLRI